MNICKLLKNGWNEQTVEYAPVDDMRGYRWILTIIEEGLVAVADLNGRIVGAACASPYMPAWSIQWMLDMEFIYVLPSFRSAGVADELRRFVEAFADKVKLPMTFGIQSGDRPEVKDRLMTMAGWMYVGGNFLRPNKDGQEQEQTND